VDANKCSLLRNYTVVVLGAEGLEAPTSAV
jgi:hypothetical protein